MGSFGFDGLKERVNEISSIVFYVHFKNGQSTEQILRVCNVCANAILSISSIRFIGQKSLRHQPCGGSKGGSTKDSRTILMIV